MCTYNSTHRTCSLICLIFALGVCRLKYWDDLLCHIHRNHRGSVSPYVLYPNQQVWNCEWPLHHQTRHSTDVLFVLLPTVTKLYSYSCPTKKQLQPFIHSELVNQIQRQQISRTRTKHCQYFLWTWVPSLTEMSSNLLLASLPLLPITGSKQENKRRGCQCGKLQKYFQESLGPHLSSWDKSSETQQLRIVVEDQVDDRLEATGHRHVSHNRMTGNDWNIFGKGSHNSTNLLR